ncbi:MAG: FTR1 family protein [Candidatus Rokubacteria bacterium]|nr:FTR1 family protein [Candidatus Rokubacteria bacterium]
MGATFLVTLREALEAALLLGILYTYLEKVGARDHFSHVTLGGVLGLLASIALGVTVSLVSGVLVDVGPDVVTTAVMFLAVVLLTWHAWWMRQHAQAAAGDLQRRIDAARASRRLWIVGLIAFTGVFREGAETVLFLWGLMGEAASGTGWSSLLGGVAGIATAGTVGWGIFRGGRRVRLQRFFAVTSACLTLFAAGLFTGGIARLQALELLPLGSPLWDTSFALSDGSVLGGFLGGLIGYRARPTGLEVAAYGIYLLGAWMLLGRGSHPRARRLEAPAGQRPSTPGNR